MPRSVGISGGFKFENGDTVFDRYGDGREKLYITSGQLSSVLTNSQSFDPDMRIQNRLVNLNFAGWHSNTYELQQNGWQISVQELHENYTMRIAMKHPATGLYGMTAPVDHSRMHDLHEMQRHTGVEMFVVAMGQNLQIGAPPQPIQCVDMNGFNPVDARPSVTMEPMKHIDDFNIFRPLGKSEQIIIPDESVSELLEKIHKLQDPKQLEIRERRRKEMNRQMRDCNEKVNNYNLGETIIAQVATFV